MTASPTQRPSWHGAAFGLTGFGLFAIHDAIVKSLGDSYATFQIVFFSVLLAFPLALIALVRDRAEANLRPKNPGWMALRSGAAVITGLCAFYAFSQLPLSQVYAVLFAMPVLITILSIPILGETVRLRRWIAVLVGLAGVIVVLRPGATVWGLGHIAAITAAFGGALASVIMRKIGGSERRMALMLYPMLTNFVVMGVALPFVYRPMPLAHFGALALMSLCAFLAMLCIIEAYRRAEAVVVAPMQYSQLIWATAFGAILFNETPDLWTAVGALIIVASGVYILLRESRSDASDTTPVLRGRGRPDTGTYGRLPRPQADPPKPLQ